MRLHRVVHIIPTYNERENISSMIRALQKISKQDNKHRHQILVVDDNSPDGTAEIVKNLRQFDKSLHLLSGTKKGLGVAMIRGLTYAITQLKADIVIPNEADFGFHPKHIPSMLRLIDQGTDIVIASRHVGNGHSEGWTLNRRINHWVANYFFATLVAGVYNVSDHNGAFRAIRVKNVLDQIDLEKLNIQGFGFFNYFLFKLTQVSSSIKEIPTTYKFRQKGESKISFNPKYFRTYVKDVLEYIHLCVKIRIEKITSQ